MPKTILIPIYNGMRARNFFHTDVYRELAGDPDLRLIIVVPSSKVAFYRSQFPDPGVIFEALDDIGETRLGEWLAAWAYNLLPTRTMRFRQRTSYLKYGNYPKYLLKRLANRLLGPLPVRSLIRALDRAIPEDANVAKLFMRHKPDLLLAPDIVFGVDRVFVRSARRRGVPSVGMVRSWDNLTSKGMIQLLPDRLIVHTTKMKLQAKRYAGMATRRIFVAGPPEYDHFFRPPTRTRAEFFREIGVDPSRRLVLFAPFFDTYTGSAVRMINALVDALENGELPGNVQFVIRYRPATPEIDAAVLRVNDHITITKPCTHYFPVTTKAMLATRDWEFTARDVELLYHSLYFSEVVINTFSTLTIDAAALDKPVIGIRFDADPDCPALHSVKFVPDMHDHYRELEDARGVRLVCAMPELIAAINDYLEHPERDAEGRRRIRAEQIEFTDGQSGKRTARYIKNLVQSIH
ncbi:MAG: CDP-glycerol glycerophosphotransferase family protein [bacterium]|nr:CDP-glycerol glycerophosphotransferase family protein [bacterium]